MRHQIRQQSRVCLVEDQEVVYRSGNPARQPQLTVTTCDAPGSDAPWQLSARPGPTLLFRFSALTANAHRIHYDLPYTTTHEGFPALIVHGPLLVLLMLELVRCNAPGQQVRAMTYRLRRPVFAGEHIHALGDPGRTEDPQLDGKPTCTSPRHAPNGTRPQR